MGAEHLIINREASQAALILGLQPAALIDHVARVDWSLLDQTPGERGGSIPVILKFNNFILLDFFFLYLYIYIFIIIFFISNSLWLEKKNSKLKMLCVGCN